MNLPRITTLLSVVLLTVLTHSVCKAQETESIDRDGVYRVQPGLEEIRMELVPKEQIRVGLAYNYFHESLGRRVWGIAQRDGSFRYAFGEGTILPTEMLDLRISKEMEDQILERGAPGLRESLKITGDTPSVQIDAEGNWALLRGKSGMRVFDLTTGKRWEWHGRNRKAVLHTYGDRWRIVEGRYVPATGWGHIGLPCCSHVRAGSAMLVMRSPD